MFFFNDTATTEIYTLSLHDALPISMMLQKIKIPANTTIRLMNDAWLKINDDRVHP